MSQTSRPSASQFAILLFSIGIAAPFLTGAIGFMIFFFSFGHPLGFRVDRMDFLGTISHLAEDAFTVGTFSLGCGIVPAVIFAYWLHRRVTTNNEGLSRVRFIIISTLAAIGTLIIWLIYFNTDGSSLGFPVRFFIMAFFGASLIAGLISVLSRFLRLEKYIDERWIRTSLTRVGTE